MRKIISIMFLAGLPAIVSAVSAAVDLEFLLNKTSEYCRKLEGVTLDFICREEIKEMINPVLDSPPPPVTDDTLQAYWLLGWHPVALAAPPKIHNAYAYDYQCIRVAGKISETRTLLEENGKEKNESNAKLKTAVFVFGSALLSPVGIFADRFQKDYDYSVAGEDIIDQRPVIIINAGPKPGAPVTANLYGKAWIDPATAEILKIEWSEERVGRYEIFEKRGQCYDRTPRVTLCSEFRTEKNGIRFPSRLVIEEAYLNKRGRVVIRSETEVNYKDFKFFTVDVEVRGE